jgi:hypothetical protein
MKRFIISFLFIFNLGFSQTDPGFDSSYVFFTVGIHGAGDESDYVVVTNNDDLIDQCQAQLELPEEERLMHINGFLDYGDGEFNQPWSWHIIPNEWVLADMSIGLAMFHPKLWKVTWIIGSVRWDSYVTGPVS